jgi:GNAT superfamily N-acetyltransferase
VSLPNADLRLANFADIAELARLRWDFSPDEIAASGQSFGAFLQGFSEFLARALSSGDWAVWVAEQEGRLVANVWVQIVQKVPRPGRFGGHNRYGYVTNVYAEPETRGRGVGSRLLQCAITWAREQELEFLVVWPSEESVRFYQRAGFQRSADALEWHFDD